MAFTMASLQKSKSGGYTARKSIPNDVRDEYRRVHGQGWEARFTAPAAMSHAEAKLKFTEWLAEIENRINSLRAARTGDGQSLTQRQAFALAGEWYRWFVSRHEDEPGNSEGWHEMLNDLQYAQLKLAPAGFHGNETDEREWAWTQEPDVRARMRPAIAEAALAEQFLANGGVLLSQNSRDLFLDTLANELTVSIRLLIRRSEGDYTPDAYPLRFPQFAQAKLKVAQAKSQASSSMSSTGLFERWVAAKKPAQSTINRWRAVFISLEQFFCGASIADLSEADIRRWKDQLITARRSARTVADVWLTGGRTVFEWARLENLLSSNPFSNVSVSVPRRARHRDTNAFTPDEIKKILGGALAVTRVRTPFKAATRWVPWLCAYTGARAGEITQLRGSDIIKRDGVDALRITPEAGSTKTGLARTIPIHEHLVAQGFLNFVAGKGHGPLFYNPVASSAGNIDPTNPKRPRAVKTRERLAAWVRTQGVTDSEIRPNHGWRHTFKQIAERHGISERVSDEITGHSPVTVGRAYGRPTLTDMASALRKFPRYKVG